MKCSIGLGGMDAPESMNGKMNERKKRCMKGYLDDRID